MENEPFKIEYEVELSKNQIKIFKENDIKIKYMELHFGNRYYEMFGNLIMENYSVQDAIDKCYEYFTR